MQLLVAGTLQFNIQGYQYFTQIHHSSADAVVLVAVGAHVTMTVRYGLACPACLRS
jgi:hypothetical protein